MPLIQAAQFADLYSSLSVVHDAAKKRTKMVMSGFISPYGEINERAVRAALKDETSGLDVEVNSGGGDVFEAITIFNLLDRFKGEITYDIIGSAASAMTFVILAGKNSHRRMAENAFFMVHGARGFAGGQLEDIEDFAKLLADVKRSIAGIYRKRTKLSDADIDELLSREGGDTWMNAEEALEAGFIDEIVETSDAEPHVQPKNRQRYQIAAEDYTPARVAAAYEVMHELDPRFSIKSSPPPVAENPPIPPKPPKSSSKSKAGIESEETMEFEAWAESQGFVLAEMSEAAVANLRQMWERAQAAEEAALDESDDDSEELATEPEEANASTDDSVVSYRKQIAAELRRSQAITQRCGQHRDLAAQAIENNWSDSELKLQLDLRNAQSELKQYRDAEENGTLGTGFVVRSGTKPEGKRAAFRLLEAAMAMQMQGITDDDLLDPFRGINNARKLGIGREVTPFTEQELDRAHELYANIDLKQFITECNRLEGNSTSSTFRSDTSIEASYSSVAIPATFKTTVTRAILAGYRLASRKWSLIAGVDSVTDFKPHERYRVFMTGRWERVSQAGDLQHGEVKTEDQYTARVVTEGQYLMITREDIINGDIGAVNDIATSFSVYGNQAPEFAFWECFGTHVITGASPTFDFTDYTKLDTLWKNFCDKVATRGDEAQPEKDEDLSRKNAIEVDAGILVTHKRNRPLLNRMVMGEIGFQARGTTDGTFERPIRNVYEGMFDVVDSIFVKKTDGIALLPNREQLPALRMVFLNGRQVPTVNRVTPAPNKVPGFGIQGWIDVSCVKAEDIFVTS